MGFYEEIRKKADSRSLDLSVKPEIGLDRLMPRIEKELRELILEYTESEIENISPENFPFKDDFIYLNVIFLVIPELSGDIKRNL